MIHRAGHADRPPGLSRFLLLCLVGAAVLLIGVWPDAYLRASGPAEAEASLGAATASHAGRNSQSRLGDSRFYPRRYYPDATSEGSATPLVLLPGDRFDGSIVMLSQGETVRGRVLGPSVLGGDPQPLSGALVRIFYGNLVFDGLSDLDGYYTIEGVPSGSALLRVATDDPRSRARRHQAMYYPGVEDADQATPIFLDGSDPFEIDDITVPLGAEFSGHVLTPDIEQPLGEIPIVITERNSLRTWHATTKPDGYFWQGGLGPGDYLVFADTEATPYVAEYLDGSRDFDAAAPLILDAGDSQSGLVIEPDLGGTITGRILTLLGKPIVDTEVQVIQRSTGQRWVVRTNVAGLYRKDGLATAQYLIYAPVLNRYFPDEPREEDARPIAVVEGEIDDRIDISGSVPEDCRLEPSSQGVIRGQLDVEYETTPRVVVRAASDRDTVETVMTNGNLYTLDCLPEGDYKVGAFAAGGYRRHFYPDVFESDDATLVTVDSDSVESIDLILEEGVVIDAEVLDDLGASPLEGVRVVAREVVTGTKVEGVTGPDGHARFEVLKDGTALPAGTWILYADSTVVPDPEVTPVIQPHLEAEILAGGMVRLRWRLSPEVGWSFQVFRHPEEGGSVLSNGVLITQGEAAPGGPGYFEAVDDPKGAVVTYRLLVRVIEEPIEFETWSNVLDTGASFPVDAAWSLVAAPSPWGRGESLRIRLKSAIGTVEPPWPIESLLWHSADGRRLEDVPWSSNATGNGFELHIEPETMSRLSTGVYFLKAQDERGHAIARGVVVISR